MKLVEQDLESIIAKYPVFELQKQKLHCAITGHDLPNRVNDLDAYVRTKKFQTAWEIHRLMEDHPGIFEELDGKHIGCRLTKTVIARDPKDIRKHLEGKKFKRALARGATIEDDDEEDEELIEDEFEEASVEMEGSNGDVNMEEVSEKDQRNGSKRRRANTGSFIKEKRKKNS